MAITTTAAVQPIRLMSGINMVTALWLFISPFGLFYANIGQALWNSLMVGAVVFILAVTRMNNPMKHIRFSWMNSILGLWLIISPFLLGYGNFSDVPYSTATWNHLIFGLIILASGAGSAITSSNRVKKGVY